MRTRKKETTTPLRSASKMQLILFQSELMITGDRGAAGGPLTDASQHLQRKH
jgi:hypothetical protein